MKISKNKLGGLLVATGLLVNSGCCNKNASGKYQIAGYDQLNHEASILHPESPKPNLVIGKPDQRWTADAKEVGKNGKELGKNGKENGDAEFLKALDSLLPLTPKKIYDSYRDLKDSCWVNSVRGF